MVNRYAQSLPKPGVPPSIYNQWVPRATTLREANAQLFGLPNHPEFKGLEQFADLADNKESSQRIAVAAQTMFDRIIARPEAHGSLVNLLSLESGLVQQVVQSTVQANRDLVLGGLKTNRESDCLDAVMASFATVMGYRSFTRAGQSEVTNDSLRREIPVPGYSARNSHEFYNKLAIFGVETIAGAQAIPSAILLDKFTA